MIMASRRAPIQSLVGPPAAFLSKNTCIYLALEMFYTSALLMGGGDASVAVGRPGERGFRQVTAILLEYCRPIHPTFGM
jgi:hypothetical protein